MIEVRQTAVFVAWLKHLRDRQARARIVVRIRRMEMGNPGQTRALGEGVSEMKIDYGPGYRVYFSMQGEAVTILLCGGSKKTQSADIRMAKQMAKENDDAP